MEGSVNNRLARDLRPLLEAKSAVVVGVSSDPNKQGRVVLRNLINGGFLGPLFGIGRNPGEIAGVTCVTSVDQLPEGIDLAFLAVAAEAAPANVRALAAMGVRTVIVGAAGFAENADAAGLARQSELQRISLETGIRIVGPNCNGIYNTHSNLSVGFNTAHSRRLKRGDIAIISHSGALFDAIVARIESLGAGLSFFVSAGNEVDLDVLDYLEYAVADSSTRVIALLLDSLSDGPRFRELARQAAEAGKHIVVLHFGTSSVGAEAAVAHSSRLVGNPKAYAALFAESDVPTVSSLEGLTMAAVMLSAYGRVNGGLAALSSSGAGAALLVDIAQRVGIRVPPFEDETQRELGGIASFSHASNPIDLGIFQGNPHQGEVVSLVAADKRIGALVVLTQSFHGQARHPLLQPIVEARRSSGKPVLVVAPGGLAAEEQKAYEAGGVRVFNHTETVLEGISSILRSERQGEERSTIASEPAAPIRLDSSHFLNEPDSLALLAEHGVTVVPTRRGASEREIIQAAEAIGWPVVLKGLAPGMAHKTEHGLVKVGIGGRSELVSAYSDLGCREAIVQPMIKGKLELIAGVTRVPGIGLLLLAGLGGIFAEVLDDVLLWPVPTPIERVRQALLAGTIGRIKESPRWNDAQSFDAFVELLDNLQRFAERAGDSLQAVDINPIILGGGRAVAVDALIVPAEARKNSV